MAPGASSVPQSTNPEVNAEESPGVPPPKVRATPIASRASVDASARMASACRMRLGSVEARSTGTGRSGIKGRLVLSQFLTGASRRLEIGLVPTSSPRKYKESFMSSLSTSMVGEVRSTTRPATMRSSASTVPEGLSQSSRMSTGLPPAGMVIPVGRSKLMEDRNPSDEMLTPGMVSRTDPSALKSEDPSKTPETTRWMACSANSMTMS